MKEVYAYTRMVLMAFDENGTYPDMVQIGNEIRCGMMCPVGAVTNWDGRLENKDATWEYYDISVRNDNFLSGGLLSGEKVQVQIIIDTLVSNIIHNGAFEEELCHWEVEVSQGVK